MDDERPLMRDQDEETGRPSREELLQRQIADDAWATGGAAAGPAVHGAAGPLGEQPEGEGVLPGVAREAGSQVDADIPDEPR